jgi:16S rRNA (cytosine967-C5)-methyltransferase
VQTRPYREGGITIEDKASVLAGLVAAPEPGNQVFDICAAPGAKTAHLAQLMHNEGMIYSVDKSISRLSLWKNEMSRLGVQIAYPIAADAAKQIPANIEGDVVILDPPCSNTGTFWKSPAAKWTADPGRIHQNKRTQSAMLENASRFVRVGGTLVYSTCTILAEENEHVVSRFLRLNPDFQLAQANPRIGLPGLYGMDACQRLYPHVHECNGHFICRMMRVS